jgi:menaquinone-dependent protoporphyrinogen oxidase
MCEVPVFYATSQGQTRLIAERLAAVVRSHGLSSIALDVDQAEACNTDWPNVRALILGASVRAGKHQSSASRFVAAHRSWFNDLPSAFFSVSLSIASSNSVEVDAAHALATSFAEKAGCRPTHIACMAGCLAYTKYGWLKRLVMRRIARKEGGPTDTSRDHELTDWSEVSALATTMAQLARPRSRASVDGANGRPAVTYDIGGR